MSGVLQPGYKQTEVGVIPEDWEILTLGELGQFKNGINKSKEDFGYGFPFVNLLDVFGVSAISKGITLGLVNSSEVERKMYTLAKGDVLFVRSSVKPEGVGLTTLILDDMDDTVFSGFLIRFRASNRLESSYKKYCFAQPNFRNTLIARSTVSANTNINQDALKALVLVFPSDREEQRAIAAALSDVDALIQSQDALIAKKRAIKQAAMQQLLTGKQRLPGFSGEWEVKRLGEIAEIAMGRTPSRANASYWGQGYKWLSIADMKSKEISQSKEEITELAASFMEIIPKGTLLMSFKLSIGRLAFAGCDLFTNEAICSFENLKADAEFLYYVLGRTEFSLYGKQAVKGYTAQRDKTRALKQGMMQVLLTGQTRLV